LRHADTHTDSQSDTYGNANGLAYADSNTIGDAYGYGYRYSYSYGNAQTHANAEICANTKASSHSSAETITYSTLKTATLRAIARHDETTTNCHQRVISYRSGFTCHRFRTNAAWQANRD